MSSAMIYTVCYASPLRLGIYHVMSYEKGYIVYPVLCG